MTNLDKLIAHMAQLKPEQFNMAEWFGTACCIAGHAIFLSGKEISTCDQKPSEVAMEWLGISRVVAYELFVPKNICKEYCDIIVSDAITVLKHYRDTGTVDWSLVDGVK